MLVKEIQLQYSSYNIKQERFFALHISGRRWFSTPLFPRLELLDSLPKHLPLAASGEFKTVLEGGGQGPGD
jgi:hypothetical protein